MRSDDNHEVIHKNYIKKHSMMKRFSFRNSIQYVLEKQRFMCLLIGIATSIFICSVVSISSPILKFDFESIDIQDTFISNNPIPRRIAYELVDDIDHINAGGKVPLGLKGKSKRILVTGGAGFVGSHLVDRLIARGDSVIVVDNFFTGKKENLLHHFKNPRFELIRHDVVEPILLEADKKMESSMGEGLRSRSSGLKAIETKRKGGIEEYDMVTVEDEPLSPMARLFHDRRFDVHAVAFMASKTRISPHPVKEKLVHTLLKHPRFTSLMVVDEENLVDMKWVQTKIDLDQHIIIVEVDETQLESPDKFVEDYIYNLSKTSLDRSKPLWDLHIINVKTRQAESVVVFRVHHSLGDGTSLISLLLACTRQTADNLKLPTIPTKKRRPTPSGYSTKEGLWRLLGKIWLFMVMLVNTTIDVFMFIITIMFLKDTKTAISAPPDYESNKARRIVHRIISLDDLKFVKNAMNVTINDVALGLTQAGLSKYLNRRYAIGGKDKGATERNNNLPNGIRLRSCLCFNLRSSAGIEDLANMMENGSKGKRGWGNWFGYALLPFKIALRDNPLDYVKEAKATVDRKKRSFEALSTLIMAQLLIKFLGIKVATEVTCKGFSNSTICFTNLVGPQEEIGFCGYPITYFAPSAYGQPSALMINFQSYINKMIIAVSVDENAIPDPHQLLDDFEDSLNLIKNAVIEKGLV